LELNIKIVSAPTGTDKFYLSLLGSVFGHDARHRCGSELVASLFRFNRYSPVEKLYSVFLYSRPQLKGYLREALSNRCVKGIGKDMGSQVLISLQAVQKGEEAGSCR
jgi:hypothetical protein